jgi:hypothetical protein
VRDGKGVGESQCGLNCRMICCVQKRLRLQHNCFLFVLFVYITAQHEMIPAGFGTSGGGGGGGGAPP